MSKDSSKSTPSYLSLVSSKHGAPIDGGGGGGHPPSMEQRVAKLEADVGEIKDILKRLEPALTRLTVDMAEVKGKVSQMPTVWQLAALIVAVFGLAFTLLRFGMPSH